MKPGTILLLLVCVVGGFLISPMGLRHNLALPSMSAAYAQSDTLNPSEVESTNYFLKYVMTVTVYILIWIFFYWLIYPFFLNYYSPDYCKALFWNMFFLYFVAWSAINVYWVYRIGFSLLWMKWVFVFLGIFWILWLMRVLLKKQGSY